MKKTLYTLLITIFVCSSSSNYGMEKAIQETPSRNAMHADFLPFLQVLHQMAQPGQLLPEISMQIYANLTKLRYTDGDIIRLHSAKIANIALQLNKNSNNPEAVLHVIEALRKAH